ncbi:glutathione S-transferase family protein [Pacificispira spongiicola]|uniref:glutathione S-transferase family protein n=1 Tax=Pacificispira spongiicola TaxID=2729598 RepID=UPI001D0CA434|nr:glutathione S-transferase family protein [Pacificispira spongiicola]
MSDLTLYDCLESGNGHKVRLFLSLLNRDFDLVLVDIHKGETHTPEFLAINPNGKIPALKLGDGRTLSESNAILFYLAEGTDYFPSDPFKRAQVMSWMFWEQYQHEPTLAVARFWCHHMEMTPERKALLAEKRAKGNDALALMEKNFIHADWCVGDDPTIADISLYSYTSVCEEGGFDLKAYPAVRRWLDRVAALPGFIPMEPWPMEPGTG